eukprot:jgi/Mesen1/1497/ME000132S00439
MQRIYADTSIAHHAVAAATKKADYVVAIEGGVEWSRHEGDAEEQLMCFAWVVVLHRGVEGKARSAAFVLPAGVAGLLGDAHDKVFGSVNSKQQGGTVGLLTRNLITRRSYYAHAVALALIPFLNPEQYHALQN